MANLKIASINVRGLHDNIKRNNLYNWVTHQKNRYMFNTRNILKINFCALFQCKVEGKNVPCNN